MFRRTFWFSAGAATGVWATLRAQRVLRSLTPESLAATAANRALDAGRRARLFAQDVRAAMAAREDQLNDALGISAGDDAPTELPGQRTKALFALKQDPHDRKEDH